MERWLSPCTREERVRGDEEEEQAHNEILEELGRDHEALHVRR
jgi:hypothetical protein